MGERQQTGSQAPRATHSGQEPAVQPEPRAQPASRAWPEGLRERKKAATRQALQTAALRLFAERGYQATAVADIAAAAGVSERTFFRYFASKEDIALQDVARVLPRLQRAIEERPPSEPPLEAFLNGFRTLAANPEEPRLALLYGGLPESWSTVPLQTGARMLTMLEEAVSSALLHRATDVVQGESDEARRFRMLLATRAGLAALRTALIHFYELGGLKAQPAERFVELVNEAFRLLELGCRGPVDL